MWSICVRNWAAPLASSVARDERSCLCWWWGLCCFSHFSQVSLYRGGKHTRSIAFIKISLPGRLNCSKMRWLITKISRQQIFFLVLLMIRRSGNCCLAHGHLPNILFILDSFHFFFFFVREILWALDVTSAKPLAAGRDHRRWFC